MPRRQARDDVVYIAGNTGATVEVEFTDHEPIRPSQQASSRDW